MNKNKWIVFEGIDGSGKDTQIDLLAEYLDYNNEDYIKIGLPDTGSIGELCREILADSSRSKFEQDALMATLSTAEAIYEKPNVDGYLDKGFWVLQSRSFLSTIAYNSGSVGRVLTEELATIAPKPDVIFYLDLAPNHALDRIQSRSKALEYTETYERLSEAYHEYGEAIYYSKNIKNVIVIDANRESETIAKQIRRELYAIK